MRKPKTTEEAYESCLADGYIKELMKVNKDKIESLIENAQTNINSAKIIMKTIDEKAKEWMSVYTTYYEALRIYTEALLIFNKVNILNHQCLFVYLCVNYPYLELDWNFFEKIRTKRNGVNYYGEKVSYEDWKEVEFQFKLYISTLKKEIKRKSEDTKKDSDT